MWRNSVSFSSKLVAKANSTSSQFLLHNSPKPHHHVFLARSSSAGPPSTSAPEPSNWIQSESIVARATSASVPGFPSIAAASVLKAKEMAEVAKHYGQCYWELSKARLRLFFTFILQHFKILYWETFVFIYCGVCSLYCMQYVECIPFSLINLTSRWSMV